MNKNKILSVFCIVIIVFSLSGCQSKKEEEEKNEAELSLNQMQTICELATLECYYHNTAKVESEKKVLWWNTSKQLWIEYSGIVKVGLDFANLEMSIEDNIVTINIPDAKILSCKVDETSLTKDSYLVSTTGLGAGKITAKDQTEAFKYAQENMKEVAEADYSLLLQAQQRAQELLEKYVVNFADAIGVEYQVEWEKALES